MAEDEAKQGAGGGAHEDRQEARNALNLQCWQQLNDLLAQAEDDEATTAFVIAGGPLAFSAGGDMKDVQGRGDGLFKDAYRLRYLQGVLARISGLSVPVLAAVEGPAAGVGWSQALTCDFVIAGANAAFKAPFGSRSLVPDGAIAFHLVRAGGRLQASVILLDEGGLTPSEALAYGLVSEVVEEGRALDRRSRSPKLSRRGRGTRH
ncbi:enoyl-CoA hydratase/isomerase family protein [Mesorhizobium sp. ASY16-5R]|uniref:enoyl-CoA hydratase/isomerase family protein n=1 Tax=Mesorhizobium sp. ASY16-5R TaxID=3445772 RepID=UPI003FA0C761